MIVGVGRSSERITDHWITETTLFRGFAIPAAEFSKPRVKNLATKLFAASGRKLVVVRAVPDGPDSSRVAMAINSADHFQLWRDQYDWMVDHTRPVAQAIMIDGNALLRYRDRQGKESRTVLAGSDPLLFWRDGIQFEIVDIHRQGREVGAFFDIELLVKTDKAVSEETARRLTEEYKVHLGILGVTMVFRTDCWFVDDWFYPTFGDCGAPPSQEEFRRGISVRCYSVRRGGVQCSVR
jgi:hypothetical protein